MLDAMEAKFQFLWLVMYSSCQEFEEELYLKYKFIYLTYTYFATSHHAGIFTGNEK